MTEPTRMLLRMAVLPLALTLTAAGALGDEEPGELLAFQDTENIAEGDMEPARSAFDDQVAAFSEGTWTFHTYGSALVGDHEKGAMYTGHVGFGYYFLDGLSLNLEGVGGAVQAERDDDGGVGGLDLIARWHFFHEDPASVYIDGGTGFQQATTNFPSDSHHNFRLQLGLGGTWRIAGGAHVMGGARYLHVSNAGTSEHNDGYDGAQLYAGLSFPF